MQPIEVAIPGALSFGGTSHRTAWMRPVRGKDEAFVAEHTRALPAERATALLARCVSLDQRQRSLPLQAVRQLSVGARDTLLLELRRLSLGDRMCCVVSCPRCGESLDIDLRVSDLLAGEAGPDVAGHEARIAAAGVEYDVRFRLPSAGDLEDAARLAATDVDAAVSLLAARCIQDVHPDDNQPLPPEVIAQVAGLMSRLDPRAEILLNAQCPACAKSFTAPFDVAQFFLAELGGAGDELMREVHLIASRYHWSEREILRLPRVRRRRYLELILDAEGPLHV